MDVGLRDYVQKEKCSLLEVQKNLNIHVETPTG